MESLETARVLRKRPWTNWRRMLATAFTWGIWFTVIVTALELGWMVFVHIHPEWKSWRTPGVVLVSATMVAYCAGKVVVFMYLRRKALHSAGTSSRAA